MLLHFIGDLGGGGASRAARAPLSFLSSLLSLPRPPRAEVGRVRQRPFSTTSRNAATAATAAASPTAPCGSSPWSTPAPNEPPRKRVVVGMSGGVDSSVAAWLLLQQGCYDVLGVHMVNWEEADERGENACPSVAEYRDVQRVCRHIGIPVVQVNFVREYWNDVFSPLLEGYSEGITPNPDILCNQEIKFRVFLDHALDTLGADLVATGHYARTRAAAGAAGAAGAAVGDDGAGVLGVSGSGGDTSGGGAVGAGVGADMGVGCSSDAGGGSGGGSGSVVGGICGLYSDLFHLDEGADAGAEEGAQPLSSFPGMRAPPASPAAALPHLLISGKDASKDQSYFLSAVAGDTLRKVLFPVGELTKPEVRAVAREAGLHIADKAESMGICFVGKRRRFSDFLNNYIELHDGWFEDLHGTPICRHRGTCVWSHIGVNMDGLLSCH